MGFDDWEDRYDDAVFGSKYIIPGCFILGGLIGIFVGFSIGGIGGAILGAVLGSAGLGLIFMGILMAIPRILFIIFLLLIVGLFIALVGGLWGVGR